MTFITWCFDHFYISSILSLNIFCSIILYFLENKFKEYFVLYYFFSLFRSSSFSSFIMGSLSILLFSGLENSIPHVYYMLWLSSIAFLVLCIRCLFATPPAGPTFAIFPPFFVFILIHRPIYFFKIKNIRFSDTVFYVIFILQYILLNPIQNIIDFIICALCNFIWKIILKLISSRIPVENGSQLALEEESQNSDQAIVE